MKMEIPPNFLIDTALAAPRINSLKKLGIFYKLILLWPTPPMKSKE